VEENQVDNLIQEYELQVGDLVYLPRGVTHRGFGGVVTQVITVPGFIPGSEIGVDHHLRAINERLGLDGENALPYNLEASEEEIIK
jgi:ribosomal protein L16 Arg81 hydroxylase